MWTLCGKEARIVPNGTSPQGLPTFHSLVSSPCCASPTSVNEWGVGSRARTLPHTAPRSARARRLYAEG
eukprot:scaffold35860_cov129-Isochrysis_galbana.AAC.4